MEFECIVYTKNDGVATIKLNRPRVLNAMNKQLWIDFQAALEDAKNDPVVKVLVVTGQGRAFSTGADLKESKTRSLEAYRDYLEQLQEASRKIMRFEKPTIAAINGYAVGSGYELALACDIRIAAEEARIGSPEAKVTSSVTGGAFRLVQDLIGPGKARELLFTGDYIDGKEAERIGLVNRAVPADRLMEEAFRSNLDLRQAICRLEEAEAQVALAAQNVAGQIEQRRLNRLDQTACNKDRQAEHKQPPRNLEHLESLLRPTPGRHGICAGGRGDLPGLTTGGCRSPLRTLE